MKRFALSFVLLALLVSSVAPLRAQTIPKTPEHLDFCGIELTINSGARKYIDDFIAKLHRSETYFASLVDKANTYMPIVEEAFKVEKVPDDLKYIAIQESSFNGSAVSKSGAVGYWQMKSASAREVGLVVDKYMDERKHIYRSSVGAARYFFRINRDFDNWVYAAIGYNRGPVGALAFIDKKNYGKKTLLITAKTHWYALKAIAYKIAFQDELGKSQPSIKLQAFATGGESSVNRLASARGIDKETLKKFNPWIKGSSLPQGQNLIYYAPGKGSEILSSNPIVGSSSSSSTNDSGKPDPNNTVASSSGNNSMDSRPARNSRRYQYLERNSDPDYGKYYAILKPGETLPEIAVPTNNKTSKIREYNNFRMSERPGAGTFVMLKPNKKMRFHIVRPGDTWQIIAGKYNLDFKKLMKQNRSKQLGGTLKVGQKIYLKGKKPNGEKVILLDTGQFMQPKSPVTKPLTGKEVKQKSHQANTNHQSAPPKRNTKKANQKDKVDSSPGTRKYHTVKTGETLWRISQDYKVPLDNLRKWNRLKGNEIYPGQKLRVSY